MTRKGELGCPNCDGPCIGCWEMTDVPWPWHEHVQWLLSELRASQAECDAARAKLAEAVALLRKHACGSRETVHGYWWPQCDSVADFLATVTK